MKQHNNLFVNGKKLALLMLLSISLSACGNAKENTKTENIVQDSVAQSEAQNKEDKKMLLWIVPLVLLGAVGGIGFTADAKGRHR